MANFPAQLETATSAMSSAPVLKRKRSNELDANPQLHSGAAHNHQAQPPHQHQHQQHQHQQQQQQQQHGTLPPPAKTPKTHNHLQINYLARQNEHDLPLASTKDSMPEVVDLLNQYQGVLERHESMACNLGARPLGPILIKRFERLFEGPPRVLKSHGKDGANITWLDVVEFARNKPEQFTLGQMSEGRKVCQFYTKQCRVQISEEDYVLISSGIPQKMIPPQPIVEDEEKELGTLEILEERLDKVCKLADQVAARARQLNHRIRGRKTAILDRRANEPAFRALSPSNVALANGNTHSPTPGFVAVNSRPQEANGAEYSKSGASPATRKELLGRFTSLEDRRSSTLPAEALRHRGSTAGHVAPGGLGGHQAAPEQELAALLMASNSGNPQQQPQHQYGSSANISRPASPPAAPPASYHPHRSLGSPGYQPPLFGSNLGPSHLHHGAASRSSPHAHAHDLEQQNNLGLEKDKQDDGPFKSEMVARMESLGKGERVIPPCDRCRRLHMDCLKNLTACMGCTKKHAKCSWREVREEEVPRSASVMRPQHASNDSYHGVPMDPAMHSPLFDSAYQPPAAADAHTPSHTSHGYDQAASTGTRDDSGSEHADRPSRASTNVADADAAYGAARDAPMRDVPSTHEAETRPAQASHRVDNDTASRTADLNVEAKYNPPYGRSNHGINERPSLSDHQSHDTPDSRQDETARPALRWQSAADEPRWPPNDQMHIRMAEQNEAAHRRLKEIYGGNPDHPREQNEDRHRQEKQRVTDRDVHHNRIWADDRPGSDSAAAHAGPAHAASGNSSRSSSKSHGNNLQTASQPHRDTPDGVQPPRSEPPSAPKLSERPATATAHADGV